MCRAIVFAVAFLAVICTSAVSQESDEELRLFMPDGQLRNLPVRVYVTHDITWDMNPELRLSRWVSMTSDKERQNPTIRPVEVAPNQRWTQLIRGQEVSFTGTLLMFDLRNYPIAYYKPMTRVVPTVSWEESSGKILGTKAVIAEDEVYLGNLSAALGWTIILVALFAVIVAFWSKKTSQSYLALIAGFSGKLSLSQFQICAWTLAIGSLVAMFGFIRLEVPDIPESLLALMGLSLATSGISYAQATKGKTQPISRPKTHWHLSDLITQIDPNTQEASLSVARTQMLFWTIIMLALFVSKSLIDGVLWEVPWEMVALMGMSQAGYLSPKFVPAAGGQISGQEVAGPD